MTSASTNRRRALIAAAGVSVAALALAGCTAGGGGDSTEAAGGSITIGTTDKVTTLDPAGSYDNGSLAVQTQVFPYLLNTDYQSTDVVPDLAESAEFTSPTEYTVTLPEGLKWANGNDLTSSDVKFSFDRNIAIADPNGASSLLYNLDSVEAPDETTVVFHLKSGNDQVFPQILSSPAGPIVDEDVFSPTELTPDQDIVDGKAFHGQYTITNYDLNNLVSYKAYPDYQGLLGAPKTDKINVKYYAEASNLKLDIQEGNID
ncbi:MAG TPA: ABC transporter substrate-binding protein, partial [Agromyces sp.]|nr:ABC transporter substrate-binding protein [Agromyces sp.]